MKRVFCCVVGITSILNASQDMRYRKKTDDDQLSFLSRVNFDEYEEEQKEGYQGSVHNRCFDDFFLIENGTLAERQGMSAARLTKLVVTNTNMTMLPLGAWLSHMEQLQFLDISHNLIENVSDSGDSGDWQSTTLQHMNISHNRLKEFDFNIVDSMPNMVHADFSNNPITQIKLVSFPQFAQRAPCTVVLKNSLLSGDQMDILRGNFTAPDMEAYEKECLHTGGLTGAFMSLIVCGPVSLALYELRLHETLGISLTCGVVALIPLCFGVLKIGEHVGKKAVTYFTLRPRLTVQQRVTFKFDDYAAIDLSFLKK